jgi:competence protein ComGC
VFSDFCDLFSSAAAVASAGANLSCLDLLLVVVLLVVVMLLVCCASSSASSSESLSSAGDNAATKAVPVPCSAEKQAQQY